MCVWKLVQSDTDILLPWYSRTGWLGVKPQGRLPTDISGVCPQVGGQVGEMFSLNNFFFFLEIQAVTQPKPPNNSGSG